jgi:hypothetical protein
LVSLAYWSSTAADYGTRVANLLSGTGVPLLDATTVTSNGGGNIMTGNHGGPAETNLFYGLDRPWRRPTTTRPSASSLSIAKGKRHEDAGHASWLSVVERGRRSVPAVAVAGDMARAVRGFVCLWAWARGRVRHRGQQFRVHVHVIANDSPEAAELWAFRDRLRAEPEIRLAYEALKRGILAGGVTESVAYSEAKGEFIKENRIAKWPLKSSRPTPRS